MHDSDSPKSPERLETELLEAQFQLEQNRRRLEKMRRVELWVLAGVMLLMAEWLWVATRPW